MLHLILIIGLFLPRFIESKGHWSYDNTSNWLHDYHYCGGLLQSPIDLQFNKSEYNHRLKHLYFQTQIFSSLDSFQLINNGHSAQLNLKNHYILKNVVEHNEDYKVEQLHFHWSNSNNIGSEHLLEGKSYPLEMHIVTYSSLFPNIEQAMSNVRGLAVVGVFFELSDQPNEYLQPIINATTHIQHKNIHKNISKDFQLLNLVGYDRLRRYYRYDGSLTTPPCYESVIWNVLQEPLKISLQQLNTFRNLHDEKHQLMKQTYRPIQEIGTRKLFRSFQTENMIDEPKKEIVSSGSDKQYLSINIKLVFILISLLMNIF